MNKHFAVIEDLILKIEPIEITKTMIEKWSISWKITYSKKKLKSFTKKGNDIEIANNHRPYWNLRSGKWVGPKPSPETLTQLGQIMLEATISLCQATKARPGFFQFEGKNLSFFKLIIDYLIFNSTIPFFQVFQVVYLKIRLISK